MTLVAPCQQLSSGYQAIRNLTVALVEGLSDADCTVQSMPDASPAKWHLAHTSWFFETFVLARYSSRYKVFDPDFGFLFNSYYNAVGARHPRPQRGLLSRPSLERVLEYREYVDSHMAPLLAKARNGETLALVELGLNHEQQHQELLLTDILHLFAQNPIYPAYRPSKPVAVSTKPAPAAGFTRIEGGIIWVGASAGEFAFDCEMPRHEIILRPFLLANSAVTNRQWIRFMADDGYKNPAFWLSDGFDRVACENWQAPLYWRIEGGEWWHHTLYGHKPVDLDAPVCHISFFEADAFARWAGKRLPTEHEWEYAAEQQPINGNFLDSGWLTPTVQAAAKAGLAGLYGDVWEWTQSPYTAYPGFKPLAGDAGEYNGKFMNGLRVLKGGSCVTPAGHLRASYRNFFAPEKRWQFSGLRLAEDL